MKNEQDTVYCSKNLGVKIVKDVIDEIPLYKVQVRKKFFFFPWWKTDMVTFIRSYAIARYYELIYKKY